MAKQDKCPSCGVEYTDHQGLIGTCRDLQACISALKVIHTWAAFQDGFALDPQHTEALTRRTLEKIGIMREE
jgi:hypothetical protein